MMAWFGNYSVEKDFFLLFVLEGLVGDVDAFALALGRAPIAHFAPGHDFRRPCRLEDLLNFAKTLHGFPRQGCR